MQHSNQHKDFPFSPDYFLARERFRGAVSNAGGVLQSYGISARGPANQELTLDVGIFGAQDANDCVIISSGLHGVEGFLGSAIQLAWLSRHASYLQTFENVSVVFIHALNPFGFSWLRRVNEDNIDLNRNFLLKDENYQGGPELYPQLDSFLNPARPPFKGTRLEFYFSALQVMRKFSFAQLTQVITEGQYEYPRGLFFGGNAPSGLTHILKQNFRHWIGRQHTVHLDIHSGLGQWGTCQLLPDSVFNPSEQAWLRSHFGDNYVYPTDGKAPYRTRGGLGRWCQRLCQPAKYHYICAEFGTYSGIKVLAGLRAENQEHHWGRMNEQVAGQARIHLKTLFAPPSLRWRKSVVKQGIELVDRILQAKQNHGKGNAR